MNKKITTKKNIVIFDVDSSSVAGGLFEFGYTAKNECVSVRELFSLRKTIMNQFQYDFDFYWQRTQKIFAEVANEVHIQSLIPLDGIYCNVSSPWSSSQKRQLTYAKKKSFTFTQELADSIIEQELDAPLSQNLDYVDHDVDLIDRKTIAVFGNGYPTRNPIGKTMSEVVIDSLVTVMSADTKSVFEHIIEKSFHQLPVFTSNMFISYFDTQQRFPQVNDALIIDVAGELTDIMVVKKDQLEIIGTIPVGLHHIIRAVASSLDESFIKARKHIRLAHSGSLEDRYTHRIQSVIRAAYQHWLRAFYDFCDEAGKQGLLPNTLIMKTFDEDHAWFETQLMTSDELREHMHARASVELISLDAQHDDNKLNLEITDPELATVAHALVVKLLK